GENVHWHECECGEKSDEAAHADEDGDGKCDECDYVVETEEPHEHEPAAEWKSDETYHWHKCTGEDCDEILDKARHTASDWIVDEKATEKHDGLQHKECTVCEYILDVETIPALKSDFNSDEWYRHMMILMNQKYTITANAGEGGSISNEGRTTVKFSNNITYNITPDEGYEIEAVYVDNVDEGVVESYTFKRVNKDHTIHAVFAEIEEESIYADIEADDWFYDDVVYVTGNGLMNGTGDNKFSPDVNTTRAMIVTILWRLEGEAEAADAGFTDVAADMWYTEAIDWAAANGIVNGFGDGTFGPEKNITREQVMAILHRYAAYKGWDDGLAVSMIPQFDCSVWAENDVNWADMNGLLDNLGVDVIDMTVEADHAEIAAYLRRFCENIAE
ncbi:MAG: S-layer homology domain-containing protein, partial [Clostridia bacterium]|nr:S-layer homology domain-containing protein [Clostridia bacterium]